MKKIFLNFGIVCISLIVANSAFATQTLSSGTDGTTTTVIGNANIKMSTSVTLMAESTATAYRLSSKHLNGNQTYSATSALPSVTESDSVVGTPLAAIVPTLP